jgi:cell division protein FtsB
MVAKFKKSKKDSHQTVFFSILIGIFLFGVVGFLIISNLKINQKRTEMINRIETLKKEIQILEEKNKKLKAGILQTESKTYWEEKLREQGYKKPGEEAVVVLPPEENQTPTEKEKSFWEKIWEKLGF